MKSEHTFLGFRMSEEKLERMVAYLQKYVGRYSLQSVWDQLLREGHDPALINRAIAEYDRRLAEGPAPVTSSQEASEEASMSDPRPGPSSRPKSSIGARLLQVTGGVVLGILILVALIVLAVGGVCVYIGYQMSKEGHG